MLAHKIDDKGSSVVFPGFVQPKLDGVRCLLTDDGFYSRSGKKILGVPELEKLTVDAFGNMALDGELYSNKMTFQEIVASVKRTKNIKEDLRIEYHVYDIASSGTYRCREHMLFTMYWNAVPKTVWERVVLVDTCKVKNWEDIEHYMMRFLSCGYEGLIYRVPAASYQFGKRSKYLLKYKKMKTEDATCIGFKNGTGKYADMLGAIQCRCEDGSGVWVGTGFDDRQRYTIWENSDKYLGQKLTIKYQEKTDGGVSRFPVFVCWRDYE